MSNLKISQNVTSSLKQNIAYVSGDIVIYQSGSIPDGWLACNGQFVGITEYPDLYSKIGTFYGSASNQFAIPNLNGYGLSNPIYPTGVVGSPSSYSTPSYTSHNHTFAATPITSSSFTSANHAHSYSFSTNNTTDSHNHAAANVNNPYVNQAWTNGASNIANYTSSGSSGSHSYSSHRHNAGSQTVNVGAGGVAHAHNASGNNDLLGATSHTHTGNFVTSSNTAQDLYPISLSCRFIIKV